MRVGLSQEVPHMSVSVTDYEERCWNHLTCWLELETLPFVRLRPCPRYSTCRVPRSRVDPSWDPKERRQRYLNADRREPRARRHIEQRSFSVSGGILGATTQRG